MKRILLGLFNGCFVMVFLACFFESSAQATTVFSDHFSASLAATSTTPNYTAVASSLGMATKIFKKSLISGNLTGFASGSYGTTFFLADSSITTSTYFRAVVQNGLCSQVYSPVATATLKSITQNETTWSNGSPDSLTVPLFQGIIHRQTIGNACLLTVHNNAG